MTRAAGAKRGKGGRAQVVQRVLETEGSREELQRALHELSTHQAELEAQNAQMKETELELQAAHDRFVELFDLAPVGYVIVDERGAIERANAHFAVLLEISPRELAGRPLSTFIAEHDVDALHLFMRAGSDSGLASEPAGNAPHVRTVELALCNQGGHPIPVRLRAVSPPGQPRSLLLAVIDRRGEIAAQAREQAFVQGLLTAQDAERRRLARELHDEAGQALTAIELGLRSLVSCRSVDEARRRVEALVVTVAHTSEDLRRLARGLYPAVLDDLGLAPALERLVQEQESLTGVAATLAHQGLEDLPLPVALTVYRVVQEALTNATRHAEPGRIEVSVWRESRILHVSVVDDGHGFVPSQVGSAGLGLRGMRERVELVGGALRIHSIPNDGTHIRASLPLPERGP